MTGRKKDPADSPLVDNIFDNGHADIEDSNIPQSGIKFEVQSLLDKYENDDE